MSAKKAAPSGDSKQRAKPTLRGVSRALRVIELIAQSPMRASDAAAELQLPWATLHRILSQLESDEYLVRDSSNVYQIGPRTWLLGSTYLQRHPLVELAVPLLKHASKEVHGVNLQLAERIGDYSVVLHSQQSAAEEVLTRGTYGDHLPLNAGSKGLALLAHCTEDFIDRYLDQKLPQLTTNTLVNPTEIRAQLAEIRARDVAVCSGDVQLFTGSVASPIREADGRVAAVVCAVAPRPMISNEKRLARLVGVTQRLALSLSLGLGWLPMYREL